MRSFVADNILSSAKIAHKGFADSDFELNASGADRPCALHARFASHIRDGTLQLRLRKTLGLFEPLRFVFAVDHWHYFPCGRHSELAGVNCGL